MEEISESETPFARPTRRRPDLLTVLMTACTGLFLFASLWLRLGPEPRKNPPRVGTPSPRIELTDLEGRKKVVFTGFDGKIVWLTFWPSFADRAGLDLESLERIWKRYEGHRNFTMIVASTEVVDIEGVQPTVRVQGETLPMYRAASKTCDDFGVVRPSLPVHFVIDSDGRILASSREIQGDPLPELEKVVRSRLDELDPGGRVRFAGEHRSSGHWRSRPTASKHLPDEPINRFFLPKTPRFPSVTA